MTSVDGGTRENETNGLFGQCVLRLFSLTNDVSQRKLQTLKYVANWKLTFYYYYFPLKVTLAL